MKMKGTVHCYRKKKKLERKNLFPKCIIFIHNVKTLCWEPSNSCLPVWNKINERLI
jgi:hypothetical protein